MGMGWFEAKREFSKTWRKEGKRYRAEVAEYEITVTPVRLPVPPGTGIWEIIKHGGLPKGWEWHLKDTKFKLNFKGFALSVDEARQGLENQLRIIFK